MTDPQPDLPADLLDQLIDTGNKALNDYYHDDLCACSDWPASCASSGNYFFGTWDTDAFAIALPAILGSYEQAKQATRCASCGRKQPLRSDGTVRRHQPPGMLGGTPWCAGSCQPPKGRS